MQSFARRIEDAAFLNRHRANWILRLSAAPQFLEVGPQYLLALDAGGRVVGHNRGAQRHLGAGAALVGRRFDELFECRFEEIGRFLQASPATATRFGSLEFGVLVPPRADTWTRMVYAGPNKPVAPVADPYQMFHRLYGRLKDRESMQSVLDEVREDLAAVAAAVPAEDRRILEEHTALVREFELELAAQDR